MVMEPRIVKKGPIALLGLSFYGDPFAASGGWTEENEIGRLWSRLMRYLADRGDLIRHVVDEGVAYEVHVESEETAAKGYREVFVGIEVAQLEDVPVDLLIKILPPTTYAVFTFRGEQIASDWSMLIQQWMHDAGYESAHRYGFQRYDERFQGVENLAESVLDVYVPVKGVGHASPGGDL
jgi:predicted transcriptional regulator YdeE